MCKSNHLHISREKPTLPKHVAQTILAALSFSKYKLAMVNVGARIMQPAPDDKNAKVQIPFFAIQFSLFNVRVL